MSVGGPGHPGRPGTIPRPGIVLALAVIEIAFWTVASLGVLASAAVWVAGGQRAAAALSLAAAAFGALHVGVAAGLLGLRPWARTARLVLAWIGLLAIPVGTVYSIVVLVALLPRSMRVVFSGRPPADLDESEWALVDRARAGGVALLIGGAAAVGMVVMCGIVSAIAIPNFLNAVDRGKQKRTMMDMGTLMAGIEVYRLDVGHYPVASDVGELSAVLLPDHVGAAPQHDAWQGRFRVESTVGSYELRSAGKDGIVDADPPAGETTTFAADIVVRDGRWVQWPAGLR